MPNVLDAEPLRVFARRASKKIKDPKVAARFERMAFERLLGDERNFRPALPMEIESAPNWVRRAHDRGEALCVFALNRAAASRLHTLARRLAATLEIATANEAKRPRDAATITAAREFLDKLERASYDVIAFKAHNFARVFETWDAERDTDDVCPARAVAATRGRTWLRITSVAQLRSIGREFRNCLARTARSSTYGGGLALGMSQFWVLRDVDGAGLIVALAPAPLATHFIEVRGPLNSMICPDNIDLTKLAAAIGVRPNTAPPSPPMADAALALPTGDPAACRCERCAPRRRTPLRERVSTP
jgi:hypothetical protein